MAGLECFAISEQGPDLSVNEDTVLLDVANGVFVVADGLGGRPAGDQASRVAAETFCSLVGSTAPGLRASHEALRSIVSQVNTSVRALVREDPTLEGLGSTLTALVVVGQTATITHIGDSGVYRHRGGCLEKLTRDHTLGAELGNEQAGVRKVAPRFLNMLSRAIGVSETIEPDVFDVDIEPGDRYLLTTDGLSRSLDPVEMASCIHTTEAPRRTCERLVAEALRRQASDNLTIAVILLLPSMRGHSPSDLPVLSSAEAFHER